MPTQIPVLHLVPWSAFYSTVWPGLTFPVTRAEVRQALSDNCLHREPLGTFDHLAELSPFEYRNLHVRRIAYMVGNVAPEPIQLDVGIPHMRCYVSWPVVDGNHRLAAALYRKDTHIWADVSGSTDYARKLLKVEI